MMMPMTTNRKPFRIRKLRCQAPKCNKKIDNFLEDVVEQGCQCEKGNLCYFNRLPDKLWQQLPTREDESIAELEKAKDLKQEVMALMKPQPPKINEADAFEEPSIEVMYDDPLILHVFDSKTVHVIKRKA